jgi:hypothetical protein
VDLPTARRKDSLQLLWDVVVAVFFYHCIKLIVRISVFGHGALNVGTCESVLRIIGGFLFVKEVDGRFVLVG